MNIDYSALDTNSCTLFKIKRKVFNEWIRNFADPVDRSIETKYARKKIFFDRGHPIVYVLTILHTKDRQIQIIIYIVFT